MARAEQDLGRRSLEAFVDWVATLDSVTRRVAWCSASLARAHPVWRQGSAWSTLTATYAGLDALLHQAQRAAPEERLYARLLGTDGSWLQVHAAALTPALIALLVSDARKQDQAILRHLADREQLLSISRSLSVGEMATTIAHELNQPLGSIVNLLRGTLVRLEREPVAAEVLSQVLQKALDQARFAAGVVARMRDFVQHRQPQRSAVDLADLAADTLELLDWELQRAHIQPTLQRSDAPLTVSADRVMLQQVLVNLTRNAVEAQLDTPAAMRRLAIELGRAEDRAVLRLADAGPGIGTEAATRLFTAFFTTKPGGTGIGLSICRSIVELHGGRLWYTSNDWGGCTFHVELPLQTPSMACSGALQGADP